MDFNAMGLSPRLVTKLAEQGIDQPTPIQAQAVPLAMEGRDVMGLAQTGTGKTAAFGLPLIHHLAKRGEKPAPKSAAGLILAPTRELAKQIAANLRAYSKGSHLKVAMIVGGASMRPQIETMARGVDLLVATPGRLIDHLDRRTVRLDLTRHLILDEADQMLDMGFIHALRRIAPLLPADRQTMLFSATMPKQMAELAAAYLNDPVRVEAARPGQAAEKIDQSVHFVAKAAKGELLAKLLKAHRGERAMVFARTKHGAERLSKQLARAGFDAGAIHGNKTQGQRDRALSAFKSGALTVLVATDVAARGIDIKDVEYVYNFDLPNVAESYVHRIGRTARAGASGRAVAFCAAEEMGDLRAIERLLKRPLNVAGGEPWEKPVEAKKPTRRRRGGPGGAPSGGPRRRRRGGGRAAA